MVFRLNTHTNELHKWVAQMLYFDRRCITSIPMKFLSTLQAACKSWALERISPLVNDFQKAPAIFSDRSNNLNERWIYLVKYLENCWAFAFWPFVMLDSILLLIIDIGGSIHSIPLDILTWSSVSDNRLNSQLNLQFIGGPNGTNVSNGD